jgi:Family of unknown function (DUF5681)
VPNPNDSPEIGYGKPPKHTQFSKGRSGNPKGRPKGSQNLATIVAKTGRERVNVTTNGRTRSITKLEASVTQLANKAAAGDHRAIRELLFWIKTLEDSVQAALPAAVPHERDHAVMTNIIQRIRHSDPQPSDETTNLRATDPSTDGK